MILKANKARVNWQAVPRNVEIAAMLASACNPNRRPTDRFVAEGLRADNIATSKITCLN